MVWTWFGLGLYLFFLTTFFKASELGLSGSMVMLLSLLVMGPCLALIFVAEALPLNFWDVRSILGFCVGGGVGFLILLNVAVVFSKIRSKAGMVAFNSTLRDLNLNFLRSKGLQLATNDDGVFGNIRMRVAHRVLQNGSSQITRVLIDFSQKDKRFGDEMNILLEQSMSLETYTAILHSLNLSITPFQASIWRRYSMAFNLGLSILLLVMPIPLWFLFHNVLILVVVVATSCMASISLFVLAGCSNFGHSNRLWERAKQIAFELNGTCNGAWRIEPTWGLNDGKISQVMGLYVIKFWVNFTEETKKELLYQFSANSFLKHDK